MLRVVLDANVFIAALLNPAGAPGQVVRACFEQRYELIVTPRLLHEVDAVAARQKIASRISPVQVAEFLEAAEGVAASAADPPDPPSATRDPDDDHLVALAVAERADVVVTGDRDLLDAGGLGVRVATPVEFLVLLAAPS